MTSSRSGFRKETRRNRLVGALSFTGFLLLAFLFWQSNALCQEPKLKLTVSIPKQKYLEFEAVPVTIRLTNHSSCAVALREECFDIYKKMDLQWKPEKGKIWHCTGGADEKPNGSDVLSGVPVIIPAGFFEEFTVGVYRHELGIGKHKFRVVLTCERDKEDSESGFEDAAAAVGAVSWYGKLTSQTVEFTIVEPERREDREIVELVHKKVAEERAESDNWRGFQHHLCGLRKFLKENFPSHPLFDYQLWRENWGLNDSGMEGRFWHPESRLEQLSDFDSFVKRVDEVERNRRGEQEFGPIVEDLLWKKVAVLLVTDPKKGEALKARLMAEKPNCIFYVRLNESKSLNNLIDARRHTGIEESEEAEGDTSAPEETENTAPTTGQKPNYGRPGVSKERRATSAGVPHNDTPFNKEPSSISDNSAWLMWLGLGVVGVVLVLVIILLVRKGRP